MKVEMVMPQMGESITEGTILKWIKKEGDVVEKDENILEISTDKVDSEIPAPAAGKIVAILAAEGETVPVGQVIAHLETDVSAAGRRLPFRRRRRGRRPPARLEPPRQPCPPARRRPRPRQRRSVAPPMQRARMRCPGRPRRRRSPPRLQRGLPRPPRPFPPSPAAGGAPIPARDDSGRFFSPLVRSIAQGEGIALADLQSIPGSGLGGRLTKDDLMAYVATRKGKGDGRAFRAVTDRASPRAVRTTPQPPQSKAPVASGRAANRARRPTPPVITPVETRSTPDGPIDVVPMDHIRQKIAEHMVRSKATSPHVASIAEAEMTRIVRYREAAKAGFEREEGFKLTYTPFFVEAAVRALKEFPFVNASIEGTNILVKRFIHVGMAVATDYGLIVPVLRGADTLSFLGIARGVNDLAARARAKTLKPDEVAGGTFSITNMGTVGTLFGIPIIAQPQVAILGIGAIQKRAVVRDDAIAIRDMVYLCLSYDHRLVDGAMGAGFLERVVHHLETIELP